MTNWMNMNSIATVLAEDVYAPELRNPRVSGMSRHQKTFTERIANGLNRLLGQKQ